MGVFDIVGPDADDPRRAFRAGGEFAGGDGLDPFARFFEGSQQIGRREIPWSADMLKCRARNRASNRLSIALDFEQHAAAIPPQFRQSGVWFDFGHHCLPLKNSKITTHLVQIGPAGYVMPIRRFTRRGRLPGREGGLEVRARIELAFADLQSAASPLCHRTGPVQELLYGSPRAGGQQRNQPAERF